MAQNSSNMLSRFFSLEECEVTNTGLDNSAPPDAIDNLKIICSELDKVRNQFGRLKVNSGYRSHDVNKAVGGAATSQHTKGQAIDFVCLEAGVSLLTVAEWIKNNCFFDQLICEGWNGTKIAWIHMSKVNDPHNRREVLTMCHKNGKTSYTPGLPALKK